MDEQTIASAYQVVYRDNKNLVYLTTGTVLALDLPASIFLMILIYRAVTKYQAKGMTLWLLVALTTGIFSYACANIINMIAVRRLINAG